MIRPIVSIVSPIILFAFCVLAHAQAGPPMITDDPGTPGDGHYEINLAALSFGHDYNLPLVDFNYGVGDRLQLKLETPFEVDSRPERRSGLGNGLAGVKWRFFDAGDDGWQISTYPQVEFLYPGSASARRGLADAGTNFLLPIEVQRKVGEMEIGFEGGRWLRSADTDSWIAGAVIGEQFTDRFEAMFELHDERLVTSSRQEFLANIGTRVKLSDTFVVLAAFGHDIRNTLQDRSLLISYLGLQIAL